MRDAACLAIRSVLTAAAVIAATAWANDPTVEEDIPEIRITSTAFEHGGMIPATYTCDGEDISPPLAWDGVPENAKTLALIVDDPNAPAGTWIHWVVYNIPADTPGLGQGVPALERLKNGSVQGVNDFRAAGYGGPCPPEGEHRYFFRLFALRSRLPLRSGATEQDLRKAMEGKIVGQGILMGRYERAK